MLDFVVFHGPLLRKNFSKQQTKLRNIPLTVSEVIQEFALRVVGIDFERQIERSARSNDTKFLIEHNERFSNCVDDSVRKRPGIRSPVEICLGTSPSQAPKSRPLENTSPVPIAATIALEMIGPMPGTVIRREHA